jgi:putative lipoic acid-binding regulatory protein
LLVYAAVVDLRKREVPYVAGLGILLFGGISLFWNQHWLLGVFYLVAVMGSRGGLWGLAAMVIALTTLAVPGLLAEAHPFIIAIFFIIMMFRFKVFGQGDAVLAFGLLAIAYEDGLWMPLALLGTSILGIIPLFWKRTPKEILALFFNSVVYSRSIDHFLIQEWHSIFNRFSQLVLISLERWKNSSEDERKGIKCDYVISFEVGMDYISDFVRAWTKGSRSTIEGPIRSIYHTGGITKIAYFYSLISKKIEEQLNRVAELRGFPFSKENGESNYQFFVVPSWTSVLESHYIFKELPPDYGRLMPIKIPIEDYFNFHRIGLLFHELGHYYPSQRVDRNSYFFSQVIRAMSMSFAEEYLQELIRREDEDDWNHANNAKCQTIVEIIKEVRKWTENQVVEIIRNHVEKDIQENINKQISKFGDYLKVRLRKFIIADEENFLDKKISIVQEELNKAFLRHRAELRENMLNDTGPEESKGKDKLLMYELSIFLSRKGFRPDQIDTADKGKDEETGNDKVQEKDNQGKGQNNGYSLGNGCWSTDYYQLLGEEIATWRELLKEVKADYFMCKTLRFTREQYHKTLDKKDTLTLNCDMYKESARHDQIERRKSIVELTGIFEKREGRIENDWRTDMADIIKTGIADKEMSEFLDTPTIKACQDFCNENNSDKNSLVLLYSVLCQG